MQSLCLFNITVLECLHTSHIDHDLWRLPSAASLLFLLPTSSGVVSFPFLFYYHPLYNLSLLLEIMPPSAFRPMKPGWTAVADALAEAQRNEPLNPVEHTPHSQIDPGIMLRFL